MNDARRKAETAMQEKMAALTGGLPAAGTCPEPQPCWFGVASEIERLIQLLARLPGLGPRSARRAALHLIKKREALMTPLSPALQVAMDKIEVCKTCGNIDTQNPCTVCTDPRRDPSDHCRSRRRRRSLGARTRERVNGRYHVLGGTLSPLDGVGPQDLTIDAWCRARMMRR